MTLCKSHLRLGLLLLSFRFISNAPYAVYSAKGYLPGHLANKCVFLVVYLLKVVAGVARGLGHNVQFVFWALLIQERNVGCCWCGC